MKPRTALGALIVVTFSTTAMVVAEAGELRRAAELGPETLLAEPAGGFVGQLSLEPERGPVGTPVRVRGEGLPADEEFDLVWHTVKGSWKVDGAEYHGRDYAPVGYRVTKVRTGQDGTFSASFDAPDDFGFWHDISVQQGGRLFTQAAFQVEMTVDISPKSGPVGTPISVRVKGIGWRQLENSWLLLYDNAFTGWMSSVTQAGSARFTIPATGSPGKHVLEVLHGDFTFAYRNMQQSPSPDRPRFALSFEIVNGDADLPAPPEDQVQASVRGLKEPGAIVVRPAFATVGQPIVVTGDGFEPGRKYPLHWSTVTGNRVSGNGWEEYERVVGEATADASGRLAFHLQTPDDLGGNHDLRVATEDGDRRGTFWIAPSAMPLDIGSGPAGTTFTVHLKGVGWTETANIYAVNYDNSYIGYACGFNSQGDVVIHLRATGEPGWHFIDLYPAIYKGKESRPVNFRLPQLTYAEDHPGEDLPRFSFAFEVTGPAVR